MSTKTFFLPDLGEGLPDATIVEWAVKVGEVVRLDAPLVSMETAKAVVEVPSPFSGKVVKLYGGNGDIIITGAALVDIELDPSLPQRAEAQDKELSDLCVKAYNELDAETLAAVREAAHARGLPVIGHVPRRVPFEVARLDDVRRSVEGLKALQQRIQRRSKARLTDREVRAAIDQGRL